MSKKLAGKKYCGSHSTVIDAAYAVVSALEKQSSVDKISLGIIRSCRASSDKRNIKTKRIPAGLEMVVRGNSYVQTIYIYTNGLDQNMKDLAKTIGNYSKN